MTRSDRENPNIGILYGEVQLSEVEHRGRGSVWPVLFLCSTAAGAAAWVGEHYEFPVILLGLLVGLALGFAARNPETHRGLDLASGTFLRVGIVLLGLKVSTDLIAMIGVTGFISLLAVMVMTQIAGLIAARIVEQSPSVGLIAGGATAICGASAALHASFNFPTERFCRKR